MGILIGTGGFSPEQMAEAEPSDSERGTNGGGRAFRFRLYIIRG